MTATAPSATRYVLPLVALLLGCCVGVVQAQPLGTNPAPEKEWQWTFPEHSVETGLGFIPLVGDEAEMTSGIGVGPSFDWHASILGPLYFGISSIPVGGGSVSVDGLPVLDHVVSRWMVSCRLYLPIVVPAIYVQAGLGLQWDYFAANGPDEAILYEGDTVAAITYFHGEWSLSAGMEIGWFAMQIGWTAALDDMTLRFTDDVGGQNVYTMRNRHRVYIMFGMHFAWSLADA